MKKLLLTAITFAILSTPAFADIPVMFLSINPWGGVNVSQSVTVPDMTRADIRAALGDPWRQYGFLDAWLGGDQIYLVYYNIAQVPMTVVILPVTSW